MINNCIMVNTEIHPKKLGGYVCSREIMMSGARDQRNSLFLFTPHTVYRYSLCQMSVTLAFIRKRHLTHVQEEIQKSSRCMLIFPAKHDDSFPRNHFE